MNNTERANVTVANLLRDRIRSGHYRAGDWLPTERILAEDLSVDRRVVRTAINDLVRDGLVYRRPHCRPIVGTLEAAVPEVTGGDAPTPGSSSNFIALLMCHGSVETERSFNSQQRIFWGMNQALSQAGRHAVFLDICMVTSEEENAEREAKQLRYLLKQGFGGVIFYPYAYRSNRALVEQVAAAMPLVTIDRRVDSADTDFVGTDNSQGMYDAIRHLAAQGHQRIAYITKNEPILPVQDRIQGYIAAMRDAGLVELVLPIPSRSNEQEWVAVETVFQLPPSRRPTAAAAFNDYAALDLMRRLDGLGLSVPGDVALTGFDDIVSALPNGVGLTTVAQPYEGIGRTAAEMLLRRMKDPFAPMAEVELPARLVVRESSPPPVD